MAAQKPTAPPAPQAPQPKEAKKRPPTPGELIVEMGDWLNQLRRAFAGVDLLQSCLHAHNGQLPEGERRRGLPILACPATIDGVDSVKVEFDLRKVDPAYLEHVLVPLVNSQYPDLLAAVEEIGLRVTALRAVFSPPEAGPTEGGA
jgi:hypothetical protein